MPPIAGGKPLMCFAWTSGRALRAGEDLRYRRPAGSDRRGPFAPGRLFPRPGCWRTARSSRSPPPVKGCPWCRVNWWVGSPRVSTLPGALPDIAGHGPPDAAAAASLHTLAVLPASTTGGALGGILLRPVTSWSGATFSSLALGFRGGCGGYAGWPPSSTDRAFRWTPSPAKSGAAEPISTSSRTQAPAIPGRWRGRRCVRSSRPAGPRVGPDAAQPARCQGAARLVDRFSARRLPAQPARPRRRVTDQSGGSAASSAVVISGAFSRVAIPPSRP